MNARTPDAALLGKFGVQDPELVDDTAIATIVRVRRRDRSYATLKIYCDPAWRTKAMGTRLLSPSFQLARAETFSAALKLNPGRLLSWAAAKCALSIAWRAKGTVTKDDEIDLLELLLSLAAEETDGRY